MSQIDLLPPSAFITADPVISVLLDAYLKPEDVCSLMVRTHAYRPHDFLEWLSNHTHSVIDERYHRQPSRNSMIRYRAFAKSMKCVGCGIEGNVVIGEHPKQHANSGRLNLYHLGHQGLVSMTVDHILPDSLGGRYGGQNFQVMCSVCNTKKQNLMSLQEIALVRSDVDQYAKSWMDKRVVHLILTLQEMAHHSNTKTAEALRRIAHNTAMSVSATTKPTKVQRVLTTVEHSVDALLIGQQPTAEPPVSVRSVIRQRIQMLVVDLRYNLMRLRHWVR